MRSNGSTLVVLHGGAGSGPAERMMARARVAAARGSIATALAAGFEAAIVATDSPEEFEGLPPDVRIDGDSGRFEFDSRLRDLVGRYSLERPVVMGSGAVPLLQEDGYRAVRSRLDSFGVVVTNNFFSSDLTGWCPGSALGEAGAIGRDNALPRRLRDDAGLAPVVLERTMRSQFDLDTPADLAVLALLEGTPPLLAERASRVPGELVTRYRSFLPLLCDPQAEIVVAGRIGSQAWQYLERETACRVRIFSEERGLAAAGRGHQARSVLGFLLADVGPELFCERMAEMGDALVLDLRVLEAHAGARPSREDRFQGDMFCAERIQDGWLREFVAAARAAPGLVLLGGHTLVSGGLMALNDQAWTENDRKSPGQAH